MKLAIFDIDGTLTCTNKLDQDLYIATARALLGFEGNGFEPESFTHFTDACMAKELWQQYKGEPSAEDLVAFEARYIAELEALDRSSPEFAPLRGATDILLRLLEAGWAVALATGCWRSSAELKLAYTGVIVPEHTPISTSSTGYSREEIVRNAILWAEEHYNRGERRASDFEKIVYLGDGAWDLRTCARLGLPFVGVAGENDPYKENVNPLGDFLRLRHYEDLEQVLWELHRASAPDRNASLF